MKNGTQKSLQLPQQSVPFRTSRALLGLISATILLAALLAYSTWENINRQRSIMEEFLRDKGETIIRSIEAGSRTYTMHHMGGGDPLHSLIRENGREEGIVFIQLTSREGTVLDHAGTVKDTASPQDVAQILDSEQVFAKLDQEAGLFVVARAFRLPQRPVGHMTNSAWHSFWNQKGEASDRAVISVGLATHLFDAAHRQDVHHTIFMAAILFLVGTAGLHFLFLYHRMWLAKATLADMKLYTDNVFESIPVGLLTLDSQDRVVSCNQKTELIFGRPYADIRGMDVEQAFPDCLSDLEAICDDGRDHNVECDAGEGAKVPVSIHGSHLLNHEGHRIGKVLIIKDMSSIREMELQLERSRRMAALGRMAAGIAHEIRNPLGTLRGFAQHFGRQAGEGSENKTYADLMVSEVDRLNNTISSLLQFARPREPVMQEIVLDQLLMKTRVLMGKDLASKMVHFSCTTSTGISCVGDPDLLLQVLMNLLKNSIAATPEGGEVSLSATADQSQVRITVADSGHGMSQSDKEKMFDPFFTTKKTGTGLGLTVSHQILEQHQGSFEVQSSPGEGTIITLILPQQPR